MKRKLFKSGDEKGDYLTSFTFKLSKKYVVIVCWGTDSISSKNMFLASSSSEASINSSIVEVILYFWHSLVLA